MAALHRGQVAEVAVELVVRVLPDRAGVEHHDIGLLVASGTNVPMGLQQPGDPLGVVHVHLAAVGPDLVGAPGSESRVHQGSRVGAGPLNGGTATEGSVPAGSGEARRRPRRHARRRRRAPRGPPARSGRGHSPCEPGHRTAVEPEWPAEVPPPTAPCGPQRSRAAASSSSGLTSSSASSITWTGTPLRSSSLRRARPERLRPRCRDSTHIRAKTRSSMSPTSSNRSSTRWATSSGTLRSRSVVASSARVRGAASSRRSRMVLATCSGSAGESS